MFHLFQLEIELYAYLSDIELVHGTYEKICVHMLKRGVTEAECMALFDDLHSQTAGDMLANSLTRRQRSTPTRLSS